MGKYLGKCEGVVGDISVVAGVRTRARAALTMAAVTTSTSTLPAKKIKKAAASTTPYTVHEIRSRRRGFPAMEENSATSSPVICRPDTTTSSPDVVVVVEAAAANCSAAEVSSDFPASCSSRNNASRINEVFKDRFDIIADPEVQSAQTSSRHLDSRNEARGESKIIAAESDNLDSPTRSPDVKSTVQIKMPSDSEIEEFFTVAEKNLQKRFADKYNFDVVKEVPLEGRYEWVQIKP